MVKNRSFKRVFQDSLAKKLCKKYISGDVVPSRPGSELPERWRHQGQPAIRVQWTAQAAKNYDFRIKK